MKEIKNDRYIIKYIEHSHNILLSCNKDCYSLRNNCIYRNNLIVSSYDKIVVTTVKVLLKNISTGTLTWRSRDFQLIDNNGFAYKAVDMCDRYIVDKRIGVSSLELPSKSQNYFLLFFPELDANSFIHKIVEYDGGRGVYQDLIIQDNNMDDTDKPYSDYVSSLKDEIVSLKEEISDLKLRHSGVNPENFIKYKIDQDDDYLYIISDEEGYTVSFNREFDKSVDNYNWVDKDSPLITIRLDNVFSYENCPTKISSPCSGIFECNSNKLIEYNSIICKIKKYKEDEKTDVLLAKERDKIKETVYKKERKKALEREALDELISDGLVFNSYIDKQGNRSKIPYDIANAVWNRDGGKCIYCGSHENLEFDHIIPISKGGATSYRNLQLLCEKCNRTKSDKI